MINLDKMTQARWNNMSPEQKDAMRDLVYLVPELIGQEGWRIEAVYPDGTKERYYVSRSTGWKPCHIAVKTRRAFGGAQVWWPEGTTFKRLYRKY